MKSNPETASDLILNYIEQTINEKSSLLTNKELEMYFRCFPDGVDFTDISKSKPALDLVLRTVKGR